AREDRAAGPRLAPRAARQLLHPVPLPGGGGEPPDDRRDRPVREDPGVQVLCHPGRAAGGAGMTVTPQWASSPWERRIPGVEARAGKFPGPSLIPALNAIQARLGWL